MDNAVYELNEIEAMTVKGLDESHLALDQLKVDCQRAALLVRTDLAEGAVRVVETAECIHDFLVFEQSIVDLFSIDPASVLVGTDSLEQAEVDMQELLASFDQCLESMDVVGVSELLGGPVPAMLTRFQALLKVFRAQIHDNSKG